MRCINEQNKLRKNTRRKLRVALGPVLVQTDGKAAKVNSWRSFCETINKVPELTRLRKIFAKDWGAIEEPLRLLTGVLTKTPGKAVRYSWKVNSQTQAGADFVILLL